MGEGEGSISTESFPISTGTHSQNVEEQKGQKEEGEEEEEMLNCSLKGCRP